LRLLFLDDLTLVDDNMATKFKKNVRFRCLFRHYLIQRLCAGQFMHRKSQMKPNATLAAPPKQKREPDCSLMQPTSLNQKNENQNGNSTPKKFD